MMQWDDDTQDNTEFEDPEFAYARPYEAPFDDDGDCNEYRSVGSDEADGVTPANEENNEASHDAQSLEDDGIVPQRQHIMTHVQGVEGKPQVRASTTGQQSDTANAVAAMARAAMQEEHEERLQRRNNTSVSVLPPESGSGRAALAHKEASAFRDHVRKLLTEVVCNPARASKAAWVESMSHDARHALLMAPPLIADDNDAVAMDDDEEWNAPPGAPFWEALARVCAALALEHQRENALGEHMLSTCDELGIPSCWSACMLVEHLREAPSSENVCENDELERMERMKTNPLLRLNNDGLVAEDQNDCGHVVQRSVSADCSSGAVDASLNAPSTMAQTQTGDGARRGSCEETAVGASRCVTTFQSILATLPPPILHSFSTIEGYGRFFTWEHGLRCVLRAEEDAERVMHEIDETVRTVCDAHTNDLETNWDLAAKPAAVPMERLQEIDNVKKEICVLSDCIASVGRQLQVTCRNVETKRQLFEEACAERRATEVILSPDEMREAHRQIGAMEAEIRQMSAKEFLPNLVKEQVEQLVKTLYEPQILRNHDELQYLRSQIAMLDQVEQNTGLAHIGAAATPKHASSPYARKGVGRISLSDQAVFLDSVSREPWQAGNASIRGTQHQ